MTTTSTPDIQELLDAAYAARYPDETPEMRSRLSSAAVLVAPHQMEQLARAIYEVAARQYEARITALSAALSVAASVLADDLNNTFLEQHPDILSQWSELCR